MSIMDRLKKNSTVDDADVLSDSIYFNEKDMVTTPVPMINVALSGNLDGGITPGHTMFAGPSKHFKTSFALMIAAAYMKAHPGAGMLLYDSEFGSPLEYFETYGIDSSQVLHTPIKNVEQLKFDIMKQLEMLKRGDKVVIVIDSIGNMASKKEVEDALSEKSVADMTRAKALKGLFRMITPYLSTLDIPLLTINHTYKEIGLFPKDIVGGGTGAYYSADNIWIIGRQQDKDTSGIKGYHFIINVEKSRYVREKSKIPISVSWEGGIQKWSGLLDIAVEGGYVHKGKKGKQLGFSFMDPKTGEVDDEKVYYERETMNEEFWNRIFTTTDFKEHVRKRFQIVYKAVEETVEEPLEDIDD